MMNTHTVRLGWALCVAALIVASQGCSQNKYSSTTRISQDTWRADLDDCREVKLSFDLVCDRESGEPDRRYEQLTLEVRPQEHLRLRRAVKKVELKPGVPRGQFKYRDVEIRTDAERRKVWFVDTETSRIVATLDLETRITTGPDDEAPGWATPDGGAILFPSD